MTIEQIVAIVQSAGVIGLLTLAFLGGFKEWWYFGSQVRKREAEAGERFAKLEADRDEWKQMALGAIGVGEKIADGRKP